MADVMESFTLKGRRGSKYDWDAAGLFGEAAGKVVQFKQGEDFDSQIPSFVQAAQKEARERGGTVESRTDKKAGVVQLRYDPNGKPQKRTPKKK